MCAKLHKLIVTGGAGFIGSEFVRQGVSKGYSIVVVDKLTYAGDLARLGEVKDEITFYKKDISDFQAMEKIFAEENPDAVVHFAAETHVDRTITDSAPCIKTNVLGTHVLLDVAKESELKKFVYISTDEVYGEIKSGQFFEDHIINPSSPYSASKAAADMLVRAYHRTYQVPGVVVRPSNNYGPWQFPEKLLPVAINKVLNNEMIPVYAEGKNVREWLHVSDCAAAIFSVMEKAAPGEIFNIGSGQEYQNLDVVKDILKLMGKDQEGFEFVKDRPGHDFRYSLNSEKIKNKLGWVARTQFKEGLRETVKWYVDNRSWMEKVLLNG